MRGSPPTASVRALLRVRFRTTAVVTAALVVAAAVMKHFAVLSHLHDVTGRVEGKPEVRRVAVTVDEETFVAVGAYHDHANGDTETRSSPHRAVDELFLRCVPRMYPTGRSREVNRGRLRSLKYAVLTCADAWHRR